jgi:ACR3 family arsenite efflux pump ArsB
MTLADRMERRQVPLYLAALTLGVLVSFAAPGLARPAGVLAPVALGLLIYVTFLGVPLGRLRRAWHDGRFMVALVIVNFVVAPAVAWVCTRWLVDSPALLLGALLVLLCPCVDYVVAFTGVAGGDRERLLAATPLLMLLQACLLPLWLWLFSSPEAARLVRPGPFVESFAWMILLPLLAAAVTQWWAGRRSAAGRVGARVAHTLSGAMVPLMMLTLALVTAAHAGRVGAHAAELLRLVPVYVGFAAQRRAVVFSGVTRNSLVVLPLALAISGVHGSGGEEGLAALAVVAQTLVELVLMVIMVRLLPRLVPDTRG